MKILEIVLYGLLALMVGGGGLIIWLMWTIMPKDCWKCGAPGRVVNEKANRWYCFDHMGEEPTP